MVRVGLNSLSRREGEQSKVLGMVCEKSAEEQQQDEYIPSLTSSQSVSGANQRAVPHRPKVEASSDLGHHLMCRHILCAAKLGNASCELIGMSNFSIGIVGSCCFDLYHT